MKILTNSELTGDLITLNTTKNRHINGGPAKNGTPGSLDTSFRNAFNKALSDVNELEFKSNELTQAMVTDPDSVNIHDVQIASEKADMAVYFTKAVVDKVITAYKKMTEL